MTLRIRSRTDRGGTVSHLPQGQVSVKGPERWEQEVLEQEQGCSRELCLCVCVKHANYSVEIHANFMDTALTRGRCSGRWVRRRWGRRWRWIRRRRAVFVASVKDTLLSFSGCMVFPQQLELAGSSRPEQVQKEVCEPPWIGSRNSASEKSSWRPGV